MGLRTRLTLGSGSNLQKDFLQTRDLFNFSNIPARFSVSNDTFFYPSSPNYILFLVLHVTWDFMIVRVIFFICNHQL